MIVAPPLWFSYHFLSHPLCHFPFSSCSPFRLSFSRRCFYPSFFSWLVCVYPWSFLWDLSARLGSGSKRLSCLRRSLQVWRQGQSITQTGKKSLFRSTCCGCFLSSVLVPVPGLSLFAFSSLALAFLSYRACLHSSLFLSCFPLSFSLVSHAMPSLYFFVCLLMFSSIFL